MRALFLLILCVLQCIWVGEYLSNFEHSFMSYENSKALTFLGWAFCFICLKIDEYIGYADLLNKNANILLTGVLVITFIIFGLHYLHYLWDNYYDYYFFLFLCLLHVIPLLFQVVKHYYLNRSK